jgi:hypothetical protein
MDRYMDVTWTQVPSHKHTTHALTVGAKETDITHKVQQNSSKSAMNFC